MKQLFQMNEIANTTFHVLSGPSQIRKTASQMSADEDPVDPREIDKVLTEVAGMAGRWSLFRKFLYNRLQVGSLLLNLSNCLIDQFSFPPSG